MERIKKYRFPLITLAILLAGALAAGLAAGAVISPPAGEVRSAGVLNVPTVLGQTADEILFYPWPMYDAQELYPIPEELSLETSLKSYPAGAKVPIADLLHICDLLFPAVIVFPGLTCDPNGLADAFRVNFDITEGSYYPAAAGQQLFLREYPAQTADGTPVTLNMALSGGGTRTAYSCFLRPGEARELTAEEQAAAREKVESDLRDLLLVSPEHENIYWSWRYELETADSSGALPSLSEYGAFPEDWPDRFGGSSDLGPFLLTSLAVCQRSSLSGMLDGFFYLIHSCVTGAPAENLEAPEDAALEDLQASMELNSGCSFQLVTTPEQIVVLVTMLDGQTLGVYYDIQLDCWSGIGLST